MTLKYQIKSQLRHLANNTLGRLHFRQDTGRPNIAVFSNRRGGSTWLIELLSNEAKTKRVVEIYDTKLNFNPYQSRLPESNNGFYVGLNKQEQSQLLKYFDDIESGRIVYNSQWKFWQKPYHFCYDRVIFKIFYAKNYIHQFAAKPNTKVIFQMRNPIPTAMSIARLKWPNCAPGFLRNEQFIRLLSSHQIEVANEVLSAGSDLEQHVLGWYLENFIPMHQTDEENWLILKYEDMVRHPETTVESLSKRLQLSSAEKIIANYLKPSYNSFDSISKIQQQNKEQLCEGWRDKLQLKQQPLLVDLCQAYSNRFYSVDF